LKNTPTDILEEQIFDIVGQFNHSLELLNNQAERLEIVQLNLMAGQKAKMATAYGAAINYLTVGRACLSENSWESAYPLTLHLFTEAAEAAYLSGDFEQMVQLVQVVLQHAQTSVAEVKVCEISILAYIAQNQPKKAIQTALVFLNRLGISLPEEPTQEDVSLALQNTHVSVSLKPIRSLIDLPLMTDTQSILAVRVMMAVTPAAYATSPNLMILLILKQVQLSLEYGNVPESSFSYACYGFILCSMSHIESGYQFGRLGLDLLQRLGEKGIQAKVIEIFNVFVRPWKEHVIEALPSLLESYQVGLETGDIEYGSYSIYVYSYYSYFIGKPLVTLEREMAQCSQALARLKQENILSWHRLFWQVILNLTGHVNNPCRLTGDIYDENTQLPLHQQAKDRTAIHHLHVNKCILHYMFQEYVVAVENAEIAEQHLDGVISQLVVAIFHFYDSLARLALYPSLSAPEQEAILTKVSANQQKMSLWAKHAPMNFQHKYDLVEAERCRVLGKDGEAREFYDKAIELAHENEYINEEALAYELAGQFYWAKGKPKIAQVYLADAHYAYQQWGALAKVKDLEARYPQLLTAPKILSSDVTITDTLMSTDVTRMQTSKALDLDSVTKAAQTLTSEIVLDKLLEKMMHIVIENAGAERGFLLLPQGEQWIIEAEGAIDKPEVTTLHSLPAANHLPEAIISYVARTHDNVVLADARREGIYTENSYIKTHQTQSVLCFPIIYQQQLRAILYLENNLTTGAFTPQRLNVLKMLSSQIAISLENAQVMANLDTKVKERTAQLNAKVEELTQTRHELVQSEKMASLGRLVAGFAHELNTPLGVAIGSASMLQRKAKKVNSLVEQEEVDVDELLAILKSIDKGSDLTLSNLERAANLVTSFKRTAIDQTSDKARSFHVHQVVNDTINTLQSQFKKTDIEISVDCPKALKVKSLPGALEQILTNLLMNSFIHGFNDGQNAGVIQINVQLSGEQLHLEYSDNGKGIASENLEKIFEPFFTTYRAHGGSGLGMYICYNVVTTQLHGTISCESVVGKGVVFKIDYPI
jgi:signal transduction histidine kinase/tetratricopeptide (TPR) repeat protein